MTLSPLLLLHICAGTMGLLSGTVAICSRKGYRTHRLAGVVFSISMLTLAATGAYIAFLKSQTGNILGGLLTFYMVATAWRAARHRDRQTGIFDWIAMTAGLAVGASCITYGVQVTLGHASANDGVPAGMDFFLGLVVLIAAAGDMNVLARGGIAGTQRIARHLWRMCFALFIASGSFFMGRQRIFPVFIRNSHILIFLTILPLLLLIFWMIRVRLTKAYGMTAVPQESAGISTTT